MLCCWCCGAVVAVLLLVLGCYCRALLPRVVGVRCCRALIPCVVATCCCRVVLSRAAVVCFCGVTVGSEQAVLSGFATAVACIFERPGRVNDLMLYCLPHSALVVIALVSRWRNGGTCTVLAAAASDALPTHAGSEILCFSLASAIMLGTDPAAMKPLLRKSLRWIFGEYV